MKNLLPLLLSLLAVLPMVAQRADASHQETAAVCPVEPLQVERLPDMNVPRSGHAVLWLNGELTVFGGHANGFVPTPTAEYFSDGQWHLMQMVYTHDHGLALPLSSGKVLLAGGHSEPLGIGQTFTVEFYDPATHHFDGFGCLDTKRTLMSAVETDSGRVLISGNWYHDDAIEVFDGKSTFLPLKPTSQQRVNPFMLRTAPDDVIIFGSDNTRGQLFDTIVADRLKDSPLHLPIFDSWHLIRLDWPHEQKNYEFADYTYLLPVYNDSGTVGIVQMRGSTFSLLPTTAPIPTTDGRDTIVYGVPLVDRQRQLYYLVGTNQKDRFYVLSLDYSRQPAPIVLRRSDARQPHLGTLIPVLSPDGDIIITGGIADDNFHPYATVYRLLMGQEVPTEASASVVSTPTVIIIIVVALIVLAYIIYIWRQRRRTADGRELLADSEKAEPLPPSDGQESELLQRLRQLMEQEQLYLNSELTISDLADRLGLHRNQLSDCINRQTGATFSQLVANYRVEHAKQLLRQQPDMKVSVVGSESGFANEKSFFRTFKAATGMTPSEWRAQQGG